jgi:diguanylate cyclase (GGDEF)-like protein/PAS domain S-box-containing protein
LLSRDDQHQLSQHALLAEIKRLNIVIDKLMTHSNAQVKMPAASSKLSVALVSKAPDQPTFDLKNPALSDNVASMSNLRESEEVYRQLFERHNVVMLLIDYESCVIVDANPAAVQFYGYPLESLRGMDVSKINTQPESEINEQRQQAALGFQTQFVFKHRLANNEIRTVEVHISTVDYRGKNLFFSIIHDITLRQQSDEMMLSLAFRDHLTQLPNRRLFNDRLTQIMTACRRSGQHAALIMLDLDNFKPLNDEHGHSVGDLMLMSVSDRLNNCVRGIDTVARLGGDEFVVMLNELDRDPLAAKAQVAVVAEKIRAALSAPYTFNLADDGIAEATVEHLCTASIGVMLFNGSEHNEDQIIKYTDDAMYEAKQAGRNQIRFHNAKT